MKHAKIDLMTPENYMSDAIKMIKKAKNRIFLIGLLMYRDEVTSDFIDALIEASEREVETHIGADFVTFSFGLDRKNLTRSAARTVRDGVRLSRQFRAAGAKFRWLGRNYGTLFSSRTHSKWLVVDDVVYAFGGVNTDDQAILHNIDYMLRIKSREIADLIAKEHREIERADKTKRLTRNHREITSIGEVLFDDGHPGRSIIYNTAVKYAKQADEILLVSQYSPTGSLAKVICKKPNDKLQIYFNPIENVDAISNKLMLSFGGGELRSRNQYTRDRYLHGKFMIFKMSNGEKVALTGSHNFVAAGSRIGTREVALLTRNEKIIAKLEDFFENSVK